MSVIYITDHHEVIYDVLKTRKKIIKKPPRYKNYLDTTKDYDFDSKCKKKYATMGPPEMPLPDPSNYLRKSAKNLPKKPIKKCVKQEPEQSPPEPADKKPTKPKKFVNFIRKNVQDIKKHDVQIPEPKYIDTRIGTTHRIKGSGLDPYYIHLSTYGKAPEYVLERVKYSKTLEQSKKDAENAESLNKCRYITRQERETLLSGLKQNWEEMQKEYQLLPMITDTIPKISKKTKLENDLKELEKDICLIEKHPYIYVYDKED